MKSRDLVVLATAGAVSAAIAIRLLWRRPGRFSSSVVSSSMENGYKEESPQPSPFDPSKREGYLSWDDYFMAIAFLSAKRSKDPYRQVGACLVSENGIILGIGYNGFPRGCSDNSLPWAKVISPV